MSAPTKGEPPPIGRTDSTGFQDLIARIAYYDTSALGLVSTPSPQLLNQVLDTHERPDPAAPHARLVRAALPAEGFSADPLWVAWFAAAKGDFIDAVFNHPPATSRPATRPPLAGAKKSAPVTKRPLRRKK